MLAMDISIMVFRTTAAFKKQHIRKMPMRQVTISLRDTTSAFLPMEKLRSQMVLASFSMEKEMFF